MEIKVRGWGRDMGTHTVAHHDLTQFHVSDDRSKTIRWSNPGLFARYGEVTVAWGQDLKYQGSYRVDLTFSQNDVFKLFKASYGRMLDVDLLDNGFKVSEALKKRVLSEIKLTDLTLGDLIGNTETAPQEEAGAVRPLRRI